MRRQINLKKYELQLYIILIRELHEPEFILKGLVLRFTLVISVAKDGLINKLVYSLYYRELERTRGWQILPEGGDTTVGAAASRSMGRWALLSIPANKNRKSHTTDSYTLCRT